MIELKNIDLSKYTIEQQFDKAQEEKEELFEAIIDFLHQNTIENRNHVIEEFWDTVQANLGLVQKLGINVDEVMRCYPKHLEKIKNRPHRK